MRPQAVTVADRPGESFLVSGHELPMGGQNIARSADHDTAGIDAFPTLTRFLQDAEDGRDLPGGAGFLDRTQVVVVDGHGLAQVLGVQFLLPRIVEASAVG